MLHFLLTEELDDLIRSDLWDGVFVHVACLSLGFSSICETRLYDNMPSMCM
jgi:hypothetical protein